MLLKLWKLLIKVQYRMQLEVEKQATAEKQAADKFGEETNSEAEPLLSQIPTLPINLELYEQCLPLLVQGLGALAQTTAFVAKRPNYKHSHIFFDKFCFDVLSLFGTNLTALHATDVEFVLRTVYFTLSHCFGPNNPQLLHSACLHPSPFRAEMLQKLSSELNGDSPVDLNRYSFNTTPGLLALEGSRYVPNFVKSKTARISVPEARSPMSNEKLQDHEAPRAGEPVTVHLSVTGLRVESGADCENRPRSSRALSKDLNDGQGTAKMPITRNVLITQHEMTFHDGNRASGAAISQDLTEE